MRETKCTRVVGISDNECYIPFQKHMGYWIAKEEQIFWLVIFVSYTNETIFNRYTFLLLLLKAFAVPKRKNGLLKE